MQIEFGFSDNLLDCCFRYGCSAAEHRHDSGRSERLLRRGGARCRRHDGERRDELDPHRDDRRERRLSRARTARWSLHRES